jgi:hypothetical protein
MPRDIPSSLCIDFWKEKENGTKVVAGEASSIKQKLTKIC